MLTTMHTPCGRYRWIRLPFDISTAANEFQRRLHEVLCGIGGVVVGRREFLADATRDHDRTVRKLLNRLSYYDLKLKSDKIKFKTATAPFMGHVLTPEGLKPSTKIAAAVLHMPLPQDKAATPRFLGVVTYLSKFCPTLREVVRPLRDLTHISFHTSDQQSSTYRDYLQTSSNFSTTPPTEHDTHSPALHLSCKVSQGLFTLHCRHSFSSSFTHHHA